MDEGYFKVNTERMTGVRFLRGISPQACRKLYFTLCDPEVFRGSEWAVSATELAYGIAVPTFTYDALEIVRLRLKGFV